MMPMLTRALRELGFIPIVSICIYRVVTLALNARGWQLLLPREGRPGFPTLLRLRWIGESVNGLLPVAQVGGDVARASLVTARGVPPAEATATMMADLWTGVATQVVFGLGGAVMFAHVFPGAAAGSASKGILVKLAMVGGLLLAIFTLHHIRVGRLAARLGAHAHVNGRFAKLAGGLARLDDALTTLLGRERALATSFGWHLVAWVSQVGETWLLLALVGAPVAVPTALVIESMATVARGVAFFIPSGLGVQEMAIVSVCRLVGVDMEAALALGIAKRAREVLVGVPGLVAWAMATRALRKWRAGGEQ